MKLQKENPDEYQTIVKEMKEAGLINNKSEKSKPSTKKSDNRKTISDE